MPLIFKIIRKINIENLDKQNNIYTEPVFDKIEKKINNLNKWITVPKYLPYQIGLY